MNINEVKYDYDIFYYVVAVRTHMYFMDFLFDVRLFLLFVCNERQHVNCLTQTR